MLLGLGYRTSYDNQVVTLNLNQDLIIARFGRVISESFVNTALNKGCSTHEVQEMLRKVVEEEIEAVRVRRETVYCIA